MHPVKDIGISPWPVDVVEFGADAYAHRKQVDVKKLYNQVPQTVWVSHFEPVGVGVSWGQYASMGISLQTESLRPSVTHGWATPAKMKKCCYGQENLGSICGSLSLYPIHLSHITNINPFATLSRIKCKWYIFIKKCVRSFIEVRRCVWLCFACIIRLYNTFIKPIIFHSGIWSVDLVSSI